MSEEVDLDLGVEPATTGTSVPPRRAMLAAIGGLLAIWVLVMPPFTGSDEHDHAYRAAAAARGQWLIDPVNATRDTGAFLEVPDDIVDAARTACQGLTYTRDRDCVGKPAGEGRITIASGAGRYHPLFYAVIGTAAKPFDGATALYAMRIATALLSAALIWAAARAASTWARTRWPYLAIALACTPVALYSASVAAPNGVEMMSALALWMSLIGLLLARPEHIRRLSAYAAVSGAVLATLRPLGPFWCLVIVGAVLVGVSAKPGRVAELLHRPAVLAGGLLVLLSAVQSTAWVLAVDALKMGGEGTGHTSLGSRLGVAVSEMPVWMFQTIAAFPLRNLATHPAVYACYLILFLVVMALALRSATARSRVAIALVVGVSALFPLATTVNSYDRYATVWQGRYGLPVAMGTVVLAGYALDRSGRGLRGPLQLTFLLLFVISQTLSPVYTLLRQVGHTPQVYTDSWVQPSLLLTAVVAGVSATLMWWGACGPDLPTREDVRAET